MPNAPATAKVTRSGRRYLVEFFRAGVSLGVVAYTTKRNMERNLRAYGVAS